MIKSRREVSIRQSAFAEVTEDSSLAKRYFRTCISLVLPIHPSLSLLIAIHVGETDRLLLREGYNRDAGTGLRASIYSR